MAEDGRIEKKQKFDDEFKEKERKCTALMQKGRKAFSGRDFKDAAISFYRAIKKRAALYGQEHRLDIHDYCQVGLAVFTNNLWDSDVISNNNEEDNVSEDAEGSRDDDEQMSKDLDLAFEMVVTAKTIAEENLDVHSLEKVDILNLLSRILIRRGDLKSGLQLCLDSLSILQHLVEQGRVESHSLLLVDQNMLVCDVFISMANAEEGRNRMENAEKGRKHMEKAEHLLCLLDSRLYQHFRDGSEVSEMTYFPCTVDTYSDIPRSLNSKSRAVDGEMVDDIRRRIHRVGRRLHSLHVIYGVESNYFDDDAELKYDNFNNDDDTMTYYSENDDEAKYCWHGDDSQDEDEASDYCYDSDWKDEDDAIIRFSRSEPDVPKLQIDSS